MDHLALLPVVDIPLIVFVVVVVVVPETWPFVVDGARVIVGKGRQRTQQANERAPAKSESGFANTSISVTD